MHIALFYNRDLYATYALNLLLPKLVEHQVSLFHTESIGRTSHVYAPELASLSSIEADLLESFDHDPEGSGLLSSSALCERFQTRDLALSQVNQAEGITLLKTRGIDLIVSIRFGKILRPPAIATAQQGVINLHSGLLPAFRGVMPTFWAMAKGSPDIGATLHHIEDETIDTGSPIDTVRIPLQKASTYLSNVWAIYSPGVELIVRAIESLQRTGSFLAPTSETHADSDTPSYFSFPTQEDFELFASAGLALYDDASIAAIRSVIAAGDKSGA